MSEESKKFSRSKVLKDLCEQSSYAIRLLGTSRKALFDSKIGKDFDGKIPCPVIMYAVSKALTEVDMPDIDQKKLMRGLISVCVFFLEDDDVNLVLKMRQELGGKDDD